MEYTKKLVLAAQNYLRKSTCNCGYKNGKCPQEELQSIVEEYQSSALYNVHPPKKNKLEFGIRFKEKK